MSRHQLYSWNTDSVLNPLCQLTIPSNGRPHQLSIFTDLLDFASLVRVNGLAYEFNLIFPGDLFICFQAFFMVSSRRYLFLVWANIFITFFHFLLTFRSSLWASLVAQWLRVCLPMQGTRVRALVWEDPTCRGATGPGGHGY